VLLLSVKHIAGHGVTENGNEFSTGQQGLELNTKPTLYVGDSESGMSSARVPWLQHSSGHS
ncbi:hypothetical protein J6590_097150, partial [Homalodisca vitripennis]